MKYVLFTLVALALYFVADWIVETIETRLGRRLEQRSLVFFGVLLALALSSFAILERVTAP